MSDTADPGAPSVPGFRMDLPKFSGAPGTYHAWRIKMRMALKLRGDNVWAAVEAGAPAPGGPSSATRASSRRAAATGDRDSLIAANLIVSTLSGHPLLLFTNGEDDVDAGAGWQRLQDHYASQDRLRVAELKEAQLHVPSGNLARFFERHMEIQQQLQDAGVRQDDEELFTIVWKQLPQWTTPLTLPYFSSNNFPSLRELSIRLQQLEQKMRGPRIKPQAGGFVANAPPRRGGRRHNGGNGGNQGGTSNTPWQRARGNNGGNSKGRRFRGNCHYCGKFGHKEADCRKKQRDGATGFTAQPQCRSEQQQGPERGVTFTAATAEVVGAMMWLADTGASHHVTCDADSFVDLSAQLQPHHPRFITAFGGTRVPVQGVGTVLLHTRASDGRTVPVALEQCLLVPDGQVNLVAINRLAHRGHRQVDGPDGHFVHFSNGVRVQLQKQSNLRRWPVVAVGPRQRNTATPPTAYAAMAAPASMHEVLGHRNDDDVATYCKVMGITDPHRAASKDCEVCARTKSTRHSVSKHAERTQVPGKRIHADIVDWTEDSPTGKRYSLVIVDEGSKLLHVVHLDAKRDAVAAFETFLRETTLPISATATTLQTDSDPIFLGAEFQHIVQQRLKHHQQSPPHTQAQNGIVERQVRTLSDMVRAMITGAHLDASYWSLACNHAVFLLNNMPRPSLNSKTPQQIVTGSLPKRVPQLHVFGQPAVVHISTHRARLQPKGRMGVYVGHNSSSNSHLIYFADTRTVVSSIHVRFLPLAKRDVVAEGEERAQASTPSSSLMLPHISSNATSSNDSNNDNDDSESLEEDFLLTDFDADHSEGSSGTGVQDDHDTTDESDTEASAHVTTGDSGTNLAEPASIKQALKSEQREQWVGACLEEIAALERNGVVTLVPRASVPSGRKPLQSRFVFKIKRDATGNPTRFKARWVAKGFSQRPGLDFDKTYAPTPAISTIFTLIAVSIQRRHELHQLDFKSAYLQADLDEELYMALPASFADIGGAARRYAGKVCRLLKPLYGLKQAGRAWASKLHTFLKRGGWKQSNADSCLFTKRHDDGERTFIITYVDDLIISGSSSKHIFETKRHIKGAFEAEDLGPLTWYLGLHLTSPTDGVLHITQTQAIDDIVNDYNMAAAAGVSIPMRVGIDVTTITQEPDRSIPFRQLVGSLLYVANRTRPDIAFACGLLCRFMDRYTRSHWEAAKHVVRYLKSTREHGLVFKRRESADPLHLVCYSDASFGTDQLTGRSTTGYTCFINDCLVSWSSRLQPTVALSTAEAEYMAISAAAQDVIFLRQLLADLGEPMAGPTTIFTDNQAAITIGSDRATKPRTKHIRTRHHFVRELIADGTVVLKHCPGTSMVADALTKALGKQVLEQHVPKLASRPADVHDKKTNAVEGEC